MPTPPFAPARGVAALRTSSAALDLRSITTALICVAAAAAARLAIEQFTGALVPFLFTFPAVIAATLLGGGAAGVLTLSGCQALSYAFVLPLWLRDHGASQQLVTFALSTTSAGAAIWATAAFQRATDRLQRQCQRQVGTLSLLIAEMDHRTKNNFQLAASLLGAQGLASDDDRLAARDRSAPIGFRRACRNPRWPPIRYWIGGADVFSYQRSARTEERAMHLPYEEAIGIGRVISPAQMAMILSMDAWPPDRRRDYNIDELLWKELIEPDPETISGYRLTERGERVRMARRLKEVDAETLLRIWTRTEGESEFALQVLREIEDRHLDV